MLTECAGQIHFDFVFFSFFAFDRKKNLSCRLFFVGSSGVTSKQISHQVCTLCPCDMRIWYVPAFCRSVWVFEVKFVLCGLPIESQKLAMCAVVSTVDFFLLYFVCDQEITRKVSLSVSIFNTEFKTLWKVWAATPEQVYSCC